MLMRRILVPINLGVGATRHLLWYLSYQITGEARHREAPESRTCPGSEPETGLGPINSAHRGAEWRRVVTPWTD